MTSVHFETTKADVLLNAKQELWYYGEGLKEKGQPDFAAHLQASEDEDEILSRYISDSISSLAILVPYGEAVNTDTAIGLSCELPSNFDTKQTTAITQQVEVYLKYQTVARWLKTIHSEKARDFEELCKEPIVIINQALRKRKLP